MPQNLVNHTGRTDLPALIGSNRAGGHSCLSGKDRCLFVEIPLRSRYARLTKQSHCSRAGTVTGRDLRQFVSICPSRLYTRFFSRALRDD